MNDLEFIKNKIKKHSETSPYNPKIKIKKSLFNKVGDNLNKLKNKIFTLFKK